MRVRTAFACVTAGAVVLAACGGSSGSSVSDRPSSTTTTTAKGDAAAAYVGLTKQAAIAKAKADGRPWRIAREDGERFMLTQDYDPNRVTFEIDHGKITKASLG